MTKKIIYFLLCGFLFCSCVKSWDADSQYEWQSELDQQTIQLYMMNRKILVDPANPDTLALVKTLVDDPQSLWNQRFMSGVTPLTPYQDLIGHAFVDTTQYADSILKGPSGMWVLLESRGEGAQRPADSSTVKLRYILTLENGYVADQSIKGGASELDLSGTVLGFKHGLPYFEDALLSPDKIQWIGPGRGWLFIPSRMGYAGANSGSVPAHSVLVFEITLYSIANKIPSRDS